MKKRLLSALLVLCMVFSLMPVTALAEGGSAKGGEATFTLNADSFSCADGHTGKLGSLQVTGVDISQWKSDKKITIQYEVQYRCTNSSCELYGNDDSFFSYSGKHTFTDTKVEFCHKKISESFTATIPTALTPSGTKDFSISFTLTSDKGISEIVRHDYDAASACTEWYYSTRCWECKGCESFFTREDCDDAYKTDKDMLYFSPLGHNMTHFDAKAPSCVAKGTVEYWHCERCQLKFSDADGKNELTTIETNAPLAKHTYTTNGICSVCGKKAAAGIWAGSGTTWYNTMDYALAALDSMSGNAELTINDDYNDTITLSKTCTVKVKAGVAVSAIQVNDAENCVVTVVNNGTISALTGYTGKLVLKSGNGTYGSITNSSENGTAGGLLHTDSADKFYCYKQGSTWLHPDAATDSTIENVTVAYAPLATLAITGDKVTGITKNGASVLLNGLQINTEARAQLYHDRIFCDNPDYGMLEIQQDDEYYNLYLRSTISAVKVTLDPNGGTLSAGEGSIFVQPDSPYGTLPTPTRASYRFDGWFTEKDGGTKVEETTTVSIRGNHTLYAHWTFQHEHCICGGDVAAGDHTAHTPQVFTAWNGTDAIAYTNRIAYVYLTQNVTINSNLVVDGTTLYLCLSGNTFASNGTNKIQVKNGGRLVLCDCAGGGTIKGATSGWGGACIYIYTSTVDIFGGKITGGKVTTSGGGGAIALDDSKCVLNIYGGEISGNNGKNSGGAIFLNNKDNKGGTVNMYGGTIANNEAQKGGVIYSECGGTINLVGGTISGNKATKGDGGVINMAGGTITLSGAKLTGNSASQYGGAVYLYEGVTATMTGGAISNNYAGSEGGAVHVYGKNSTFYLKGGTITGNRSVDGGAIYLNREPSVLTMTGGVISGNTATGNGGGVYIYRTGSVCNLSGGRIEQNTAKAGGGIYVNPSNSGQLKISGAPVVRGNTVSGAASNVYLPSGKLLTISGSMEAGASIGVTTESKNYPVAFSNAYATDYSGFFRADDAGAEVVYKTDQKLYLDARQYDIIIQGTDNGHATADSSRAAASKRITLTPAPSVGYHFMAWNVISGGITITKDASGKDGFTMPASNVIIQAVFAQHSFTAERAEDTYLKTAADCENDAVYYKSCACGEKGTEIFTKANSALGHDYGAWTSNDNGTHTRICSNDTSHTETKDCHGGTASCTAKAICEDCGAAYGEMSAHSFTAETVEETYLKSEATCTDKAVYYKSCAVCGLSSEGTAGEATFESGNSLGHNYGAWTSNNNGTHTRTCSRDASHKETDNCHGGTATCIAAAVCTDCGTAYGAKKPQNHADGCMLEWITTEETHQQKYSKCGQEVVPEEDHEWENGTCTECRYVCQHSGGTATCTEKAVCEICGESYSDPLGHDWGQWTVTTPATARAEGVETRTCRNDASHTETRAIPKLTPERGHTSRRFPAGGTTNSTGSATDTDKTVKSSDTGDMGVALYAVTALLSVTGMAWVGRKKRGN